MLLLSEIKRDLLFWSDKLIKLLEKGHSVFVGLPLQGYISCAKTEILEVINAKKKNAAM